MDGHFDAVSCMAKNPNYLKGIFSGSMDGDIRLWDIASKVRLWTVRATLEELFTPGKSSETKTNAIAWNPMEPMNFTAGLPREKRKRYYDETVKNRYQHVSEVKSIGGRLRQEMIEAAKKKEERRKDHSAPGKVVTREKNRQGS
ncbi:hypothetical protein SAY86_024434 [Trapa natans]|uniref:WD repeat and SOF domain-containing protein 1 n=1 Tax=Trapa natans TaxID=22666 RepID=A0AAN7RBI2_TRANT|nr:hypothetical protein SAY86_024434 [Trapa natans]